MTVQGAVLRALRKPRGTAKQGFGETRRKDSWLVYAIVQAIVFTVCAGYLTFSGIFWGPLFGPQVAEHEGYISPLFSPDLSTFFGPLPAWLSPGLLILWIPIGFRATCYYYRKAYYRFYFADPPGCAVGEPAAHRKFALENALPFVLQNLHRYLLYLAFIPLFFLWYDLLPAFNIVPAAGVADTRLRLGFGGVLFTLNVILLTGYSLSCHSLRHLVGGRVDCFSCTRARRVRYTLWQRLTDLNRNHMWWAWTSLITVTLADLYVRLLGYGVINDPAIHF